MTQISRNNRIKLVCIAVIAWVAVVTIFSSGPGTADTMNQPQDKKSKPKTQKEDPKSAGCMSCHEGSESMHQQSGTDFDLGIGCIDCHGGNAELAISPGDVKGSATYNQIKDKAHVQPRFPDMWGKEKEPFSTRNPERTYSLLIRESPEFVRFINPGDLRAAQISCGTSSCHPQEVYSMKKSMMTHGAMLWGAALYNNGAVPFKDARYGESYSVDGRPQRMQSMPAPTPEETRTKGVLPFLNPLPRYEMTQPGNVLRVFERGGIGKPGVLLPSDIGSPDPEEDPGRLDINGGRLSSRGFGTTTRTDPTFQGLQKTRLLDPLMHFMGTNDQPGDFRSSGCSACHVVYANDRDPMHAAQFAKFGNMGETQTADSTIPKNESGHPIKHEMTNGIPSSQCMICHIHPGGNMVLGYFGFTWWDNETDGEHMYPKDPSKLSIDQIEEIRIRNPEGAAPRGLWGQNPNFLAELWKEVNPKLKHTQFADFHGHGWVFRAVYKQDKKGNLLDEKGNVVDFNDSEKFKKVVQMRDIHLEKGMHCADCHFRNDSHGNGNIYNEGRAAVELDCIDCHGTIYAKANLLTSGPAAGQGRFNGKVINKKGFNMASIKTPFGKKLFETDKKTGDVYQNSMVTKDLRWRVMQTIDTIDPNHPDYDEQSRLAKTYRRDGSWGDLPDPKDDAKELAHSNERMTCYACHTSWTTSCFGCHLPMEANKQRPLLHYEDKSNAKINSRGNFRNWTQYNYQTLRDDIFFLAVDGTVTNHRIAPARSTCAVLVGSQNQLRDWIYSQQQTVSGEGFSGQAFSTFVPHTVRSEETKRCTECHVSKKEDNNAWMAQVLMQGTNFVNFMFRYVYVAVGHHGFEAIAVTERGEPQAVLGSKLHELAYPENFRELKKNKHGEGYEPETDRYEHRANGSGIYSLQLRGEYLYTANGTGGFRVYDVAQIDNKEFSERIVTAPVSPLGQQFYVRSKFATSIASPSTMAVDPTRKRFPENEEGPIHPMYAYLYGTDKEEGFIVIGPVGTLLDGEDRNNFIKRAVTFNPDGKLKGATNVTIAGTYAYVCTDHGLYVIDINDPTNPQITAEIGEPFLKHPHAVAVQFRYAFVTDEEGLKVLNVAKLDKPRPVENAKVPLADAHGIYLARTYAYVAAGKEGLAIIDITKPKEPKLDQAFTANGEINDAHDVKIGMVANSAFAFVADGHNGLRVVQVVGPDENDDVYGWSPRPKPKLIATYETEGEALAISKGIDRDRAADENGNQLGVFNRRGSRPFNKEEMAKMTVVVNDEPPKGKPREFKRPEQKAAIEVEETEERAQGNASSVPLVSFALIFFPLAFLLSRQRR
ncbi:MAG: hypothetical protein AB1489_04735 [Acidobacteriota bacterium]